MRQLLDRLPAGIRPTPALLAAAGAVGITAFVMALGLGSLGKALLAPSVPAEAADPLAAVAKDSEEFFAKSKKRFDGRSMYALPSPPVRRPRVVEAPKPVEPPKDPGPPPAPATYAGPAPSSIIGDMVVFTDLPESDRRIRVGETKSGVTVIEANGPFSCKLGHLGGTYVVSLFPRVDNRFLRGGLPASTPPGVVPVPGGGAAGSSAAPGASPTPSAPGAISGPGAAGGAPAGGAAGIPVTAGPAGANPRPAPDGNPPPDPLSSPAMQPQRLPTPVAPPGEPGVQGGGPASSEDAGQEFVDRSMLPPRHTPEEINSMPVSVARSALAAIEATSGWNVDGHSRAQLDYERELLVARINRGP